MKQQQVIAVLSAAVLAIAIGFISVSCGKKPIKPNSAKETTFGEEEISVKSPRAQIRSINSFLGSNSLLVDRYELFPSVGKKTALTEFVGPSGTVSALKGYAARGTREVFAYKDGSPSKYYIEDPSWGWGPNEITLGGVSFTATVYEIEIDPSTLEVYMLAGSNILGMKLYHIDVTDGTATLVGTLNSSVVEGSIAFVPDGSGGQTLVFTHQTATISTAVIGMKYYTISGSTLSFIDSYTYPANPIPFGSTLNTTYNALTNKFYIARNGGNLYSYALPLPNSSTTTPPTPTLEVSAANFDNRYDFGMWQD